MEASSGLREGNKRKILCVCPLPPLPAPFQAVPPAILDLFLPVEGQERHLYPFSCVPWHIRQLFKAGESSINANVGGTLQDVLKGKTAQPLGENVLGFWGNKIKSSHKATAGNEIGMEYSHAHEVQKDPVPCSNSS